MGNLLNTGEARGKSAVEEQTYLMLGSRLHWLMEDMAHEFKMHTNIALEDIPRRCQQMIGTKLVRTKQPLSKTICAFLNTDGGSVYLGIDDDSKVRGISMTPAAIEHLLLSVDDTLRRFKPKVPRGKVMLRFVPVYEPNSEPEGFPSDERFQEELRKMLCDPAVGSTVHRLRAFCLGCQKNEHVETSRTYVVVIKVQKSDGPIYSNEEGLAYVRTVAGNQCLTLDRLMLRLRTGRTKEELVKLNRILSPVPYGEEGEDLGQ